MNEIIGIIIVFLVYSVLQELLSKKTRQNESETEPSAPQLPEKTVLQRVVSKVPPDVLKSHGTPVETLAVRRDIVTPDREQQELAPEKKLLSPLFRQIGHSYRDLFLFKELLEPPLAKRIQKRR